MPNKKKFPIIKILQSVFSALLGVQSDKYMKQDFETGKLHHYVIVGIIIVIIIMLILFAIVKFVTAS